MVNWENLENSEKSENLPHHTTSHTTQYYTTSPSIWYHTIPHYLLHYTTLPPTPHYIPHPRTPHYTWPYHITPHHTTSHNTPSFLTFPSFPSFLSLALVPDFTWFVTHLAWNYLCVCEMACFAYYSRRVTEVIFYSLIFWIFPERLWEEIQLRCINSSMCYYSSSNRVGFIVVIRKPADFYYFPCILVLNKN